MNTAGCGVKSVKQMVNGNKINFKLDLESLKKNENNTEQDEQENLEFHKYIMSTLQISQRTLDELQDSIQNDPNQLTPEQLDLIARIHAAQQEYDRQKGILVVESASKKKLKPDQKGYEGDSGARG